MCRGTRDAQGGFWLAAASLAVCLLGVGSAPGDRAADRGGAAGRHGPSVGAAPIDAAGGYPTSAPALVETVNPVEEIDPNESSVRSGTPHGEFRRHTGFCHLVEDARAAVEPAILAANAANLARLCRLLI